MKRSTIDTVISTIGLLLAGVLLIASIGLFYTQSFIHTQVKGQLETQKITFPTAGSAAINALPSSDKEAVSKYAGQQLLTGAQAEVFADHYISAHLNTIGGGKTYSELSADAMKDPTNTVLASKVDTVFRGETLRGMLLNAYAFDTMSSVALIAAYVTGVAALLLIVLSMIGFFHSKKVSAK